MMTMTTMTSPATTLPPPRLEARALLCPATLLSPSPATRPTRGPSPSPNTERRRSPPPRAPTPGTRRRRPAGRVLTMVTEARLMTSTGHRAMSTTAWRPPRETTAPPGPRSPACPWPGPRTQTTPRPGITTRRPATSPVTGSPSRPWRVGQAPGPGVSASAPGAA